MARTFFEKLKVIKLTILASPVVMSMLRVRHRVRHRGASMTEKQNRADMPHCVYHIICETRLLLVLGTLCQHLLNLLLLSVCI